MISNTDIIYQIKKYYNQHGIPPTSTVFKKSNGFLCDSATVRRRFGTWVKALNQAGIYDRKSPQPSKEIKCNNCDKQFIKQNSQLSTTNFCSRSCRASYHNSRRKITDETKQKIRESINRVKFAKIIFVVTGICVICKSNFEYADHGRVRKTCSKECKTISQSRGGRHSAANQSTRSRAEIQFADLCEFYFGFIFTNKPMFNGWDADIIIPSIKTVVLYNGIWHYKQISKTQSLLQVQSRDKIKHHEIEKHGYQIYIVKDLGKYNRIFVNEQFKIFISSLNNKHG